MWVQTSYGFYSAVAHRDEPDTIIVRARSRGDLVNLRKRSNKALKGTEIHRTFQADYPFRMYVPRKVWAKVVHDAAMAIDYDNVKNSLEGPDRMQRHSTLLRVWSIFYEIEYEPTAKVHKRPAPRPYEASVHGFNDPLPIVGGPLNRQSVVDGMRGNPRSLNRRTDQPTVNTMARLGKRWENVSTDPLPDEAHDGWEYQPYPDPLEQNDAL